MKLLALDTETTGLDPEFHDVLTAYFAVLDHNLNVVADLDLKLKPDNGIFENVQEEAMRVNKINLEEHLADPETITYSQAKLKLAKFLMDNLENKKGKTLQPAGHNVNFDLDMINEHIMDKATWGKLVHYRAVDTMPVTSFLKLIGWWGEEIGSLVSIVKYLGLPMRNAHNAKADTHMFIDVLRKMIDIFKDKKSSVTGIDQSILKSLER